MPLIQYKDINFHPGRLAIIAQANEIINAWIAQGYRLTLRQIYYRFIALDILPESWIDPIYNAKHGLDARTKNTLRNYKKLGEILNDARVGGLVDWDSMEDRTRNMLGATHHDGVNDALANLLTTYRREKWNGQPVRVEVWIEKDALLGIFEQICMKPEIDVPFFSCRGYNSQSEMWAASQRLIYYETMRNQRTVILQFSDHDPSGLDMTRDITNRLKMFGAHCTVVRKALTIAQVRKLKLPPNPAKETDIRFEKYAKKFGRMRKGVRTADSWELDALEPNKLTALVRTSVMRYRNEALWAQAMLTQNTEIEVLTRIAKKNLNAKISVALNLAR